MPGDNDVRQALCFLELHRLIPPHSPTCTDSNQLARIPIVEQRGMKYFEVGAGNHCSSTMCRRLREGFLSSRMILRRYHSFRSYFEMRLFLDADYHQLVVNHCQTMFYHKQSPMKCCTTKRETRDQSSAGGASSELERDLGWLE